ncbi:MAG: hypothetical protein COA33_001820 [Fluviicola sp.]|nr:hypothetical protein [Fluviicola sp.]
MITTYRKFGLVLLIALSVGFMQSCKNKEPSAIKIFVKSYANQALPGVKVVIIGDVTSNPETISYVDTVITNESGFALFDVAPHYEKGDKDYEVAYFDVIAASTVQSGTGYVRSRIHTTAVETVYIQ